MSAEGFQEININNERPKRSEQFSPNEILKAHNDAQFKLASRYFGFDVGDVEFTKWEEEHSKDFGDIVDAEPSLILRYLRGEETEVLDEIARKVYEKHEVRA